jgi:hypothetical protein
MTAELPDQIVAGCSPILAKYGVTDKPTQGRVLVEMGKVFREVNSHDVTVARNQKKFANKVFHRTLRILEVTGGIKDMLQRGNCAKELLEWVAELIRQEMSKE